MAFKRQNSRLQATVMQSQEVDLLEEGEAISDAFGGAGDGEALQRLYCCLHARR